MAKITIDIEQIKKGLEKIGYIISDTIEKNNNGTNWQIKFSNSAAIVTIYDTNNKKNSVVNGKPEDNEKEELKNIVDRLKCKELEIDKINTRIVELVNSHKEDTYYDFKSQWYQEGKQGDFLHDILCLSNNIDNKDAYLIVGVEDDYNVQGVSEWRKSNEIYDFLKQIPFAGENIPEIELKSILYKYKKLDVLVCKSSGKVPFYITDNYRGVNPNQIYTRIGDTNTPKNKSASYKDTEKLWRIHFEREHES